jgi:starch synthase
MKILLSHAGKQHSYHLAKALGDLGDLECFHTSSYVTLKWLQDLIERTHNKFWSRRFLKGLHGSKVKSNWRFEIREIILRQLYGQSLKTLNAVYERDEKFDQFMAGQMDQLGGDTFWGFQGSCLLSLKAAKANGKITVCELAAAHAPAAIKIFEEEKELHPEWSDSFSNFYFPPRYYARLCEEPMVADYVIGASNFTLDSLRTSGVPDKKLRRLPLGFDLDSISYMPGRTEINKPARLLYAGRITQGKGIKYLLEAVRLLDRKDVELHLVGVVQGSGEALRAYQGIYKLHSPVSQQELFKLYGEYDALVLPSLFEGFGLVILEAMAAGLPVITTAHTIGPELIDHGVNGYLVPIRDVNAIADSIRDFLLKDENQREGMRKKARESALNYSWLGYSNALNKILKTF